MRRFCGHKIDSKRRVGIAGKIAIATAAIALFMPFILMAFFALAIFIFGLAETARGKRWVGIAAIILSIIELGLAGYILNPISSGNKLYYRNKAESKIMSQKEFEAMRARARDYAFWKIGWGW